MNKEAEKYSVLSTSLSEVTEEIDSKWRLCFNQ